MISLWNVFMILLIIIGLIFFSFHFYDVTYVRSVIDNKVYKIRRGDAKETYLEESADTLANINTRVMKLISYLDTLDSDKNIKMLVDKLKQNYSSSAISEAAVDKRYTTFTVDKKDMHICLRTRDEKERLYNMNTLMYVVIHELAHMCNYDKEGSPILGHGLEFKYIFKLLVEKAIEIGIYKYVDYQKAPTEYCGIVINSQIVD